MSLTATSIRINSRMDYRVRFGKGGVNRLRDLIDVDPTTADEESESKRFLIYDHEENKFKFTNLLDGGIINNDSF